MRRPQRRAPTVLWASGLLLAIALGIVALVEEAPRTGARSSPIESASPARSAGAVSKTLSPAQLEILLDQRRRGEPPSQVPPPGEENAPALAGSSLPSIAVDAPAQHASTAEPGAAGTPVPPAAMRFDAPARAAASSDDRGGAPVPDSAFHTSNPAARAR